MWVVTRCSKYVCMLWILWLMKRAPLLLEISKDFGRLWVLFRPNIWRGITLLVPKIPRVVFVQQSANGSNGQLLKPHLRVPSHWLSLSQSPSASLHLFVTEQHDHVFWSKVPLQSQDTSASKGAVRKLNELSVVKKILILKVSFVCYLAYWGFDFTLNLG